MEHVIAIRGLSMSQPLAYFNILLYEISNHIEHVIAIEGFQGGSQSHLSQCTFYHIM
jgi:hypothetical protein